MWRKEEEEEKNVFDSIESHLALADTWTINRLAHSGYTGMQVKLQQGFDVFWE